MKQFVEFAGDSMREDCAILKEKIPLLSVPGTRGDNNRAGSFLVWDRMSPTGRGSAALRVDG